MRHRHNVSTETLDRRKYRTELSDYHSIMATLPPFVEAESTAITSTEKHFDTLLSASNSLEAASYEGSAENASSQVVSDYNTMRALIEPNVIINIDYGSSVNPVANTAVSSTVPRDFYVPSNSLDIARSTISECYDVEKSSNGITCSLCCSNFRTEAAFKCHMKIHMQNVHSDGSSDALSSTDMNYHNQTVSAQSSRSVLCRDISVAESLSPQNKMDFPVKIEVSEFEIDTCMLPSDTSKFFNVPSSSTSNDKPSGKLLKLTCPVCKIGLQGEDGFKKHARMHDSYSLLKLISESSSIKTNLCDVSNHTLGSPSTNHHRKYLQPKVSTIIKHPARSSIKDHLLTKTRTNSKSWHCAQCDKILPSSVLLEYHRQLHLSVKKFSCRCCRRTFLTKTALLAHTRLCHLKTFICSECSHVFSYHKLYDSHTKKCGGGLKISSGGLCNFPVVNVESLLKSDLSDVVGVIPVSLSGDSKSKEVNNVKWAIPIMSLSQLRAGFSLTSISTQFGIKNLMEDQKCTKSGEA